MNEYDLKPAVWKQETGLHSVSWIRAYVCMTTIWWVSTCVHIWVPGSRPTRYECWCLTYVSGEAAQCLWLLQLIVGVPWTDLSVLPPPTHEPTPHCQHGLILAHINVFFSSFMSFKKGHTWLLFPQPLGPHQQMAFILLSYSGHIPRVSHDEGRSS